ncbi:2-C-methyl-D-erythritol 4-phosphate cytidylyltransferase, partial [Shimia sp.]|uniref:2-C-methyl-D-erythritol 4-phosphate cytidylyltransferase n=1 Tax=Shimia sp. TaxID=1954381 RepID=UPI00356132AC
MSRDRDRNAAILVAAGRGTRAGGGQPKQWRSLAGRRVADWTVAAFRDHPEIERVLVVTHPEDDDEAARLGVDFVHGGATRDASV